MENSGARGKRRTPSRMACRSASPRVSWVLTQSLYNRGSPYVRIEFAIGSVRNAINTRFEEKQLHAKVEIRSDCIIGRRPDIDLRSIIPALSKRRGSPAVLIMTAGVAARFRLSPPPFVINSSSSAKEDGQTTLMTTGVLP